jgi:hypothetical protein
MSHGQLVADVRLAINGRRPVDLFTRVGGIIPTVPELVSRLTKSFEPFEVNHGDESLSEAGELLCRV